MRTRLWFGEQVLLALNDGLRNRDERIDIRECCVAVDNIVNELARANFLENWKLGFGQVGEQFVTRWENLTVNDPDNEGFSYFQIPSNYVSLPPNGNGGISEVYFMNNFTDVKKKYFDPIIVTSSRDVSTYRSNMAGGLQGRLSVSVRNGNLYFNTGLIGETYGNVGIALVIKDSSQITDTAPYPIPADIENVVISRCIQFFRERKQMPTDLVRDRVDNNDKSMR